MYRYVRPVAENRALKSGLGGGHLTNDELGTAQLQQGSLQALEVDARGEVERHDLPPGVHAPVRASRAHELDGLASDLLDRLLQDAGDRAVPRLRSEAVEP